MAEPTHLVSETELKDAMLSGTVDKERARLLSFISNRTPTREDAEDILQDVFFELVQSSTVEHTAAWLYRVARNKITDWYRKMKPERLDDFSHRGNDEEEVLLLSDIVPSVETPADKQILLKLISEVLADSLEELPAAQREVFVLHELEGRSMKEIAMLTGSNVKTAISRKRYAVLYLQEKLKGLYKELIHN